MQETENIDTDKTERERDRPEETRNPAAEAVPVAQGAGVGTQPDRNIDKQPELNTNMEVHHHPHLPHAGHKKNFKEYFLEFLMIFLAVSMGFIAESLREHISDREKERQYMASLAVDLRGDTANCAHASSNIFLQLHKIDTLESLLVSIKSNKDTDAIRKCYNLSIYVLNSHTVTFNERTVNQLLSSGSMRLLRKNVSDSVMDYFSALKDIEDQRQYYIDYVGKCIDGQKDFFQFAYIQTVINADTTYSLKAAKYGTPALLTTDSVQLGKFASTAEFTKRIAFSYMIDLLKIKAKATDLLYFLQNEYDLKQ